MNRTFRFGIPSLDRLTQASKQAAPVMHPMTACIAGPDGCGKSLLAMHAVSTYWLDVKLVKQSEKYKDQNPKILYVSTDLSIEQAHHAWEAFGLNHPADRQCLLASYYETLEEPAARFKPTFAEDGRFGLFQVSPSDPSGDVDSTEPPPITSQTPTTEPTVTDGEQKHSDKIEPFQNQVLDIADIFHEDDDSNNRLFFIDLHRETAGDDWTFLNHLVGLLPKTTIPHFMVIDAVEGLEAFVGDVDGFGESRTRRSRIAQLVRICAKARVHLVFVVEETRRDLRLAEQFIADLVIRAHVDNADGRSVKTLEIEKCRSVSHVSGSHEFYIRSGRGTVTGLDPNLDHPAISWAPPAGSGNSTTYLAHFYVIPSIQHWNSVVQQQRLPVPIAIGEPTFGLDEIDENLRAAPQRGATGFVHDGSLAVLFGDAATNKKSLARAFLAKAHRTTIVKGHEIEGIAVLISGNLIDRSGLKDLLDQHQEGGAFPIDRILCRRLSVRHLSSSQFLSILECYIRKAQMLAMKKCIDLKLFDDTDDLNAQDEQFRERALRSYPIRLVIGDWNLLMATHPSIASDPLLLPSVVATLRRAGVTALIVSTEPGEPGLTHSSTPTHDLRKLDVYHIYTWSVPFFGERRTAIATSNSMRGAAGPEIYELRSKITVDEKGQKIVSDALEIDQQFALYSGLQTGNPERVPLSVRLYGGPHVEEPATEDQRDGRFAKALTQTLGQLFVSTKGEGVVTFEPFDRYDDYFAFADWLDDTRLPHSVVFQIDEFWADSKTRSLCNLYQYAYGEQVAELIGGAKGESGDDVAVLGVDAMPCDFYKVFQPHTPAEHDNPFFTDPHTPLSSEYQTNGRWKVGEKLRRKDLFVRDILPNAPDPRAIDRIPYLWDFGMILARKDLWERCYNDPLNTTVGTIEYVADVWNALCLDDDNIREANPGVAHRASDVEWSAFFDACRIVGQRCGAPFFDVDLNTAESLTSLVFEIWGSISVTCNKGCDFKHLSKREFESRISLKDLLRKERRALFLACEQLLAACGHLNSENRLMKRAPHSDEAVASREWYSTSAAIVRGNRLHQLRVLALPGHFTTRGDWFLAMAKGSRSELLGHRAMDMLSSRRMCMLRLQDGLGLPPRDILPDGRIGILHTAITRVDPATSKVSALTYEEICCLGKKSNRDDFEWLWRSRMAHYDRDCFYWRRWIARLFAERSEWLPMDHLDAGARERRATQLRKQGEAADWLEANGKYQVFSKKCDILDAAIRE